MSADGEAVTRAYLASVLAARVVTEIPADLTTAIDTDGLVLVRGYGGGELVTLARPVIETQAFHIGRDAARALAGDVHEQMRRHFRGWFAAGKVSTVRTVLTPAWQPYDNTNVRRYVARYSVYVR